MKPSNDKRRNSSSKSVSPSQSLVAGAGGVVSGVSEFTQMALWMAATLGGMITTAIVARAPFFYAMSSRYGLRDSKGRWRRTGHGKPTRQQSLSMLADAIIGTSKQAVASVFGPPRSAAMNGAAPSPQKMEFWHADAWYYPVPRDEQLAMCIQFDGDDAQHVEFFHAPRPRGSIAA